ncbi:MAG: hypothetical protein KGL92_12670 [Gammaproteobacteria bacterium]|nr:hypothetical protein [Gammaproteobacteria bacterium]
MYSWLQRLASLRHRFSYGLSEHARRRGGAHLEIPVHTLPALPGEQGERIAALRARYHVNFEGYLNAATSVRNYEYLDLLDRGFAQAGIAPPRLGSLYDVGCANFWYARTLHAFFQPDSLTGIEVEGYRRYRDGHSRVDYAAGYIAGLPRTRFEIVDYLRVDEPGDVITAWFPFLTATAILAWRLPLSLLRPRALIERIAANLTEGGMFIMVNHGLEEARPAMSLCAAAGLRRLYGEPVGGPLSAYRARSPVLSIWCTESARSRL